ncbi:MAG: hypothetical protein KDJ87_04270 [Rhizobiaceae bacterium]|nr:hypothetical protein [Rhizobiaceae bacterium]
MAKSIKLDPNFTERTVDLEALGYVAGDVLIFSIKGGYRDDGKGKDNHWEVSAEYGGYSAPLTSGKWEVVLNAGLELTFVNQDPTIGGNTDPNRDFRLVLAPGLFSEGPNRVDFNDLTAMQAKAIKNGVQTRFAGNGDDVVYLPDARIKGYDHKKYFWSDEGNDTVHGSRRADKIDAWDGNDIVHGGRGNDIIWGETGNDTIYGDEGRDRIYGNADMDHLYGGAGADRFMYFAYYDSYAGAASDWIHDFSQAEGDRIDLKKVDANSVKKGNQDFRFIGDAEFSGKAGELHYRVDGGTTYLEADRNGDSVADFAIRFEGEIDIVKADIIL